MKKTLIVIFLMFFYLSISFGYLYFKVDAYDQSHNPVSNIPFEYDRGDIEWGWILFIPYPKEIVWNNQWRRWQGNEYFLTRVPGRDFINLETSYDALRTRIPTENEPFYNNQSVSRSKFDRWSNLTYLFDIDSTNDNVKNLYTGVAIDDFISIMTELLQDTWLGELLGIGDEQSLNPLTNINPDSFSAETGQGVLFKIQVPSETNRIDIDLTSNIDPYIGNADLYGSWDNEPLYDPAYLLSNHPNNNESYSLNSGLTAGRYYYMLVWAEEAFEDVKLTVKAHTDEFFGDYFYVISQHKLGTQIKFEDGTIYARNTLNISVEDDEYVYDFEPNPAERW
ncbi:MAG: hypothetical protein U9N62_07140, partial [Thermotogota bacterium]|nr:hypothetical protein [Thermotogota bacterium]